ITTVFSHAQTVVLCGSCANVLCQPTGGRARLTEESHDFEIGYPGENGCIYYPYKQPHKNVADVTFKFNCD
ncbi:7186_t:CDS:2, partial [Scutellospora calospora]